MNFPKNFFLCTFCGLLLFALPAFPGTQIAIRDLADIFEAIETSFLDIYVEYEWYFEPPLALEDIEGTSNLINKNRPKYTWATARPFTDRSLSSESVELMNEHSDSFKSETKQSYNGNIAKHLSIGGWPNSRIDGTIAKRKDFIPSWKNSPMGFSVLRFYPQLLSEQFRLEKGIRLIETIQIINGFHTVCVEFFIEPHGVFERIFLSTDHGYTPIRFEYVKKGKPSGTIDILALTKLPNSLWFPVSGRISHPEDKNVNVYSATKVTVNQGLKDDYFDIEFPPGTLVVDEITGLQYVIKPTEEEFDEWLDNESNVYIILLTLTLVIALLVIKKKYGGRKSKK